MASLLGHAFAFALALNPRSRLDLYPIPRDLRPISSHSHSPLAQRYRLSCLSVASAAGRCLFPCTDTAAEPPPATLPPTSALTTCNLHCIPALTPLLLTPRRSPPYGPTQWEAVSRIYCMGTPTVWWIAAAAPTLYLGES